METSELRAGVYEALSECFKEPDAEFAEDVRRGNLGEFLRDAFHRLNVEYGVERLSLDGGGMPALAALRRDYDDLFNHPFRHLVPVESVYGRTGGYMGEAAREMLTLYDRAGITLPPQFAAMPDHLCLLLEFMVRLCREGTRREQGQFVARHFGWLEKLGEDSRRRPGPAFYLTAIDATVAFIQHERETLGYRPLADQLGDGLATATFSGGEQ